MNIHFDLFYREKKYKVNYFNFFFIFSYLFFLLGSSDSQSQNFYKELKPKNTFVQFGLGAGSFFSTPRSYVDSLINQPMPVMFIGVGKRFSPHFSLKSLFSLQTYANKEYQLSETSEEIIVPLFKGILYAFELTPTFNLLPSNHHLHRPKVEFDLGIGLGYLMSITTEKFTFQEKEYMFNFLKHSPYIPMRSSVIFRVDSWSDLAIEGVFFFTWLNDTNTTSAFNLYGDHYSQINLVYRRFIR